MQAKGVVVACPAKVNLALSVGAPDASGFHPIASWMVGVDLADRVELEQAKGPSTFAIGYDQAADSPARGLTVDWPLERDLAVGAHALVSRQAGKELPVRAKVVKRIAAGGGLGGGSADAAGMLVGLDRLFKLNLGLAVLQRLGAELGSDVPFAVMTAAGAATAAVATGRGEVLEPTKLTRPLHLVLVFPPFGCPTGKVYSELDSLRGRAGAAARADAERVRALAAAGSLVEDGLFNDLTAAAERVEPRLAELRGRVAAMAGRPAHVTGSGSTLFVVAEGAAAGRQAAAALERGLGVRACCVRSL